MASLLGLVFPIEAANNPANPMAFAAGPFMLFRRSAYRAIGGHRALAGEVEEDLALARRIKGSGHRLRYLLALDALELRMYANFAALLPEERSLLPGALLAGLGGIGLQLALRLWMRRAFRAGR